MNKFSYKGKAVILHINTRKEGGEDDKNLAVDLKLAIVVNSSALDFFDDGLKAFLYTDIGAVKNCFLEEIQFKNVLHHYDFSILGVVFYGVKATKFKVSAKDDYQAAITFQVSIAPSGNDVAKMAEFLLELVDISIEPQNQEFNFSELENKACEKLRDNLFKNLKKGESVTFSDGDGMEIAKIEG